MWIGGAGGGKGEMVGGGGRGKGTGRGELMGGGGPAGGGRGRGRGRGGENGEESWPAQLGTHLLGVPMLRGQPAGAGERQVGWEIIEMLCIVHNIIYSRGLQILNLLYHLSVGSWSVVIFIFRRNWDKRSNYLESGVPCSKL